MRIKQQALGGFSKESDEAVLVRGKAVLLAMTDNPNFVTPEPALETVTEILDDYDQKLAMAKRRGSYLINQTNLDYTVLQLGFYWKQKVREKLRSMLTI